ncbi:MAG: hypothetical protein FWE57_03730 [Chitinispirillia bacterium]|nr:hypothetical protein [Chitinispirillia bacterium]
MNRSFLKKFVAAGIAAVMGIGLAFVACTDDDGNPISSACTQWSEAVTVIATCTQAGTITETCLQGNASPRVTVLPQLAGAVCDPNTGCTSWGDIQITHATCQAAGQSVMPCLSNPVFNQVQTIPQLTGTQCQAVCNPPSVTMNGVCQPCPTGQVPNATHTGCVNQGGTPTGINCYWPASASNPQAECWPIGGDFCEGSTCSEALCIADHGTVIADCDNPPSVSYCNWGATAGADCHPIGPGMNNENPGMTELQACQAFGFVSQFPDCRDFVPPQHFCRWPTGCVAIANPNSPNADNPLLTNVENCQENGRYFTTMAACEAFVPPATDNQVRDFGPCEGGSGWNCTNGGCYAGGTASQITECEGATWCTIRDRCPVGHCPPAAAGQAHCM